MLDKHTNATSGEPLHKRLSSVPASVWEEEMPVMDLVIRETLRVVFTSTLLRRNVVEDITVSGGVIRPGDFIAYNTADVHQDPGIYTNADQFDPGRFLPGREEDKKSTFAFLGWGVGKFDIIMCRILREKLTVFTRTPSVHRDEGSQA